MKYTIAGFFLLSLLMFPLECYCKSEVQKTNQNIPKSKDVPNTSTGKESELKSYSPYSLCNRINHTLSYRNRENSNRIEFCTGSSTEIETRHRFIEETTYKYKHRYRHDLLKIILQHTLKKILFGFQTRKEKLYERTEGYSDNPSRKASYEDIQLFFSIPFFTAFNFSFGRKYRSDNPYYITSNYSFTFNFTDNINLSFDVDEHKEDGFLKSYAPFIDRILVLRYRFNSIAEIAFEYRFPSRFQFTSNHERSISFTKFFKDRTYSLRIFNANESGSGLRKRYGASAEYLISLRDQMAIGYGINFTKVQKHTWKWEFEENRWSNSLSAQLNLAYYID